MSPIIRNILAILAGVIIGNIVNMGIIAISGSVIPPPDGTDVTTSEGLKAAIPFFETKHFIFPFLAHALGTLTGAFVAALAAANNQFRIAVGVSVFFLIGGISAVFMFPSPIWFIVLDLAVAYLPMGYLGWKLAGGKK